MSRRTGARSPVDRERRAREIASRKCHGWQCFYCREPFTDERPYTFDHYVPYCLWRTTRMKNQVLACGPCNNAKGSALPWTVAALLLRNVQRHQLWWMACMPASADMYEEAA